MANRGFLAGLVGKESACNAGDDLGTGDKGLIPGLGRSPGEGNGNPRQYSCLEKPMDRGAWWAIVHEVARVRHDLATQPRPHGQQHYSLCLKEAYLSHVFPPAAPTVLCLGTQHFSIMLGGHCKQWGHQQTAQKFENVAPSSLQKWHLFIAGDLKQ